MQVRSSPYVTINNSGTISGNANRGAVLVIGAEFAELHELRPDHFDDQWPCTITWRACLEYIDRVERNIDRGARHLCQFADCRPWRHLHLQFREHHDNRQRSQWYQSEQCRWLFGDRAVQQRKHTDLWRDSDGIFLIGTNVSVNSVAVRADGSITTIGETPREST